MSKYLIVVDMQKDFINGSLGTGEAEKIVGKVKDKIEKAANERKVFFTMDTHGTDYLETMEGKILPVSHCVENTEGWQVVPELLEALKNKGLTPNMVRKKTFGSVELANILKGLDEKEKIEEIEIIGLCTDICVISNALLLKAFFPEVKIKVDPACCAGVTPASHENAIEAMKMCHIDCG